MNTFNKKSLCVALAAVGAAGVAGTANAVYVNPDGLGQVLIYPYYTVRDKVAGAAFNSLLSVVNTTASAKAVKVRFIEGRNSAEVLDFNLFLSAKDVWVAGIIPTTDGAGVFTPDKSCIAPTQISSDPTAPTPFVNFAYTGDGAGDDLDRTREGYVEIIEMGALLDGSKTQVGVTHVAGVPTCANIDDANATAATADPTGGLFGGMTVINVLAGEEFTQDATALNAFRTLGHYDTPGDIKPDLRDADPTLGAVIFNGATGGVISGSFSTGIDTVSAVLMHDNLYNEFVLDAGTKSGTDWVVTMPTKRYYYDSSGVVQNLFQSNFSDTGACDDVSLGLFDREEFVAKPGFSPPPKAGKTAVCWEANVITFNNTAVLNSSNGLNINTTFANGWLDLGFPVTSSSDFGGPAHVLVDNNGVSFIGLPTIGFSAITFNNGTLTGPSGTGLIQSNYGGAFKHRAAETTK